MIESHLHETKIGNIYKVILSESDSGTLTVLLPNGNNGTISNLNGTLPQRGDIIFVTNDSWKIMPEETWLKTNSIAIVRKVFEDKRVLVEANYSLETTTNPRNFALKAFNTVEYNNIDGIVRILSEKPIHRNSLPDYETDNSATYLYDGPTEGFTFEDFGGYPQVVARARELIRNQLENRKYLDAMKVRPIRGILMSGPPGTGKTFLARIIANETKAKFYLVNGPTIISKWLGDTENTIRQIFDAAKKEENGAIIFIDEIDSIAADRSGDTHEASKKLVAQLLTLMDGFDANDGNVVVIAATNRADALDPAIRRPGRFDWEIEFGLPNESDRFEILKKSIARHTTAPNLPVTEVVEKTGNWAAADLALIIAEAGQIAASDKREEISAEDFAQGYERVALKIKKDAGK